MMGTFSLVLVLCLASSSLAVPRFSQKIVGGSLTTIRQYPFTSSLLYSLHEVQYSQACGGTILTATAVLTAAHCVVGDPASRWRVRVGSSYANSGGRVHLLRGYGYHSSFDPATMVNDIAVLRTASIIQYNSFVGPATIAGPSYVLGDNEVVMAVGWGSVAPDSAASEQQRQVQIWSVNQQECRSRYAELGSTVTDNMVCSGWLDVGGRDQCQGDSGSPLIHNKVVVGICSWGYSCATPRYPGVNTRVSSFTAWIKSLV